ncbi:BREX-1 system adenine-specific DNA-methyltransferase PglX [Undibacterium sp. LX40W]|uniref:site-specific DNA-methyltransferase (adenine-specific) n=1 Tax=Undibacterium nitidum TaxID=2762298 RepID=A0A923HS85_9BURK|nr:MULTISPECIES: BREX-1 system adenine-specific DNA-methyltransferase PglX [Undibacterium]MBC3881557.1 BREX-1 system adenine-specific DNA-methyltransferase PglX [Undibacterium nitidum]MBC3891661.1 BREX-1 system adenine-specific DNA-methyltransferase PglX [Undibacterium sp. LX40W]
METTKLSRFAQYARRTLMELVEARLQLVLQPSSAARRENAEAIKTLEEAIKSQGEAQVIECVAYIWFNRFCALRFMDVNRYTRIGVVSPVEGQFQPEILAEAKMGHIDDETVPEKVRQQIFALLEGKSPSHDPQGEAYRLLVVAACNAFHRAMPFLFERIDDYTELLMPDDLLSGNSILAYTREAMTPDACEDVEVIGWLYQFYISEKKDAVFEGLKKNQKITPENIPAATQLFTPHWIVRYLVENSLGRLWMLNRPGSRLAEKMDYYIKPEQPETDFLKISSPEEIKICDPACGSGHMLTYAFDLLYAIYEEEGVDAAEIPEKILTHNLYGIEIDERAGELAAFALTMKARAKQRRFFNKGIKPNICVLENVKFDVGELTEYMGFIGRDLFTAPLQTTLRQFEEADNFGSLIRPDVTDVDGMLRILESKNVFVHLFLSQTHQKALQALRQADYLSPKYHVVIANPPYMGGGGMTGAMKAWANKSFPASKADLYSMFIDRNLELSKHHGFVAMVTMQSWMFLSSFEGLRSKILQNHSISGFVQIGYNSFPELNSKVALASSFVIVKGSVGHYGSYLNLNDAPQSADKNSVFLDRRSNGPIYVRNSNDFKSLPGNPLAYWLSEAFLNCFSSNSKVGIFARAAKGLVTANNDEFVRDWSEVSYSRAAFHCVSRTESIESSKPWFPYAKGGEFRRWSGNTECFVNWENDGYKIRNDLTDDGSRVRATNFNLDRIFRRGISWTVVTTSKPTFRAVPSGFLFDAAAGILQTDTNSEMVLLGYLNSKVAEAALAAINPTLNLHPGYLESLPYVQVSQNDEIEQVVFDLLKKSQEDWDSFEKSWGFTMLQLLQPSYRQPSLKGAYRKVREHWREMTQEMQHLEEKNNRFFIDVYGLQDELTPEVPLGEVTLTCNPYYRYGDDKSEDELEALLLTDTMRELVSYAVGCMFGRYSLDKPGLILASQGETLADYLRQVPEPSFPADDDNVIPMLDGDWFTDDITERFRQFLRVAFGEAHYEENLQFVEKALGKKGKPQPIRDYFLKEFYSDHVRRYKKRPIYWLFSSPKGTFNALIYLHRYRPDTVSVVLNGYLRDFRNKLAAHLSYLQQVGVSATASQVEKTRANKENDTIKKQLQELDDYERDVLYPLATKQEPLNLDDGVKVNYLKLGAALKKIVGLDAKEDD